jgi:vacuolar-type H+-ATPase subunit E/Vma4
MEDAASRRAAAHQIPLTAEQIRLRSERQSLEMSRTRVLKDLDSATHPRRRQQLQAALEHLDRKLSALEYAKKTGKDLPSTTS